MHVNASRSLTQPLLDCILYLTQYLYDPGTLPSSANQCTLGKVYLRSNLSRIQMIMLGSASYDVPHLFFFRWNLTVNTVQELTSWHVTCVKPLHM